MPVYQVRKPVGRKVVFRLLVCVQDWSEGGDLYSKWNEFSWDCLVDEADHLVGRSFCHPRN